MAGHEEHNEYLKETVEGRQVCVYCKKTEDEIGGRLEGHASWCKWRKDMEEMERVRGLKESSGKLKDVVQRYGR
ncbi:MAG: hypothetical protein AB1805_06805 [Nitrospirota bacterium]